MIRIEIIPRLSALILGASTATAETPGVALRDQVALANIAAFPKLVGTDPATTKINHDLFLRDKAVINALLDCSDDPYLSWYRWIEVPFNGPNFISFSVHDDVDCGGLHGNQNQTPLTYDRQTGDLVDWVALLPKSWIADLTDNAAATLMDPQVLGSAALTQVYLSLYPALMTRTADHRFEATACPSFSGPTPIRTACAWNPPAFPMPTAPAPIWSTSL